MTERILCYWLDDENELRKCVFDIETDGKTCDEIHAEIKETVKTFKDNQILYAARKEEANGRF